MERRRFLAAFAAVTTVVLGGCGNPDDDGTGYEIDEPAQPGPQDTSRVAK